MSSVPSTEEGAEQLLREYYEIYGPVVLLVLQRGVKGLKSSEWEKLTFEKTQTPTYRKRLIVALMRGGNIAVRLGPLSGGLRSVDVDRKDRVDEFEKLNPKLKNSVRVKGLKGCQFFFRCSAWASGNGEAAVTTLKCPKLREDDDGKYGEFRHGERGGAYSMIFGQHPDAPAVRWEIEGYSMATLSNGRSDIELPSDVYEKSEKPAKSYDDVEPGELTAFKAALNTALAKFSIADVWRLAGVEGEPPQGDKLVRSPFREDKNPSFSIYAGGKKWKDHATGEQGDAADFLAKAKKLSNHEACRELIRLAGADFRAGAEYDDNLFGEKKGLPEIDSADEFCIEEDDTPPEIIEGILHQGSKGELGGGSKTFKTWTLLQLGTCVAHGVPWLKFNTYPGKVLFINFELPRWSIRHRVKHICDALEVGYPSNLKLLNLRGYATDAHVILPRIAKEIHQHGFVLVIIDPLYKILGDREENASKDMASLMLAIERLAVVLNAAVLFGAHFSKGNQSLKEAMDRISGSGVLSRDPDTIITMTQHEEENSYSVDMILRNFAPQEPFVIKREHPLMLLAGGLDPARLKKPKTPNQSVYGSDILLEALAESSLAYNEWREVCHEKTGVSTGTFYTLFKGLRDSDQIFFSEIEKKWGRKP